MPAEDVIYFDTEEGASLFHGANVKGHFSPLAAYHSGEDRFLLMDVARYKAPPCWVKAEVLYNALTAIDSVSQKSRGFLIVSRREAPAVGLRDDPPAALARTMAHVDRARKDARIERPIFFSACATDGKRLWAVRYSSNNESRTLYHSRHIHALREIDGSYEALPAGAIIVLSEPLDELTEHWEAVLESSLLVVENGEVTTCRFTPE